MKFFLIKIFDDENQIFVANKVINFEIFFVANKFFGWNSFSDKIFLVKNSFYFLTKIIDNENKIFITNNVINDEIFFITNNFF